MDNERIPIDKRLEEYYRRLNEAPKAQSAEEALQIVGDTLNQLEDELSGIPRKNPPPSPNMPDGRMYPPKEDYTKQNPDGSITAKSKAHTVNIGKNGSITIVNRRTKQVEFRKLGVEGKP
jgi:hypothetical protein